MARRIIEQGAELILREEPVNMPEDVVPIRGHLPAVGVPHAVPIRNRTKVIGILSIQSYTQKLTTRRISIR